MSCSKLSKIHKENKTQMTFYFKTKPTCGLQGSLYIQINGPCFYLSLPPLAYAILPLIQESIVSLLYHPLSQSSTFAKG